MNPCVTLSLLAACVVGLALLASPAAGAATRLKVDLEQDLSGALHAIQNYYEHRSVDKVEEKLDEEKEVDQELEEIELMKSLSKLKDYIQNRGKNEACTINGVSSPCNKGGCRSPGAGAPIRCICSTDWTGKCCNTKCFTTHACIQWAEVDDCRDPMQKDD